MSSVTKKQSSVTAALKSDAARKRPTIPTWMVLGPPVAASPMNKLKQPMRLQGADVTVVPSVTSDEAYVVVVRNDEPMIRTCASVAAAVDVAERLYIAGEV